MRGIVFLLAIPLSCMLSVGVCPADPDISGYTGSCDATVMQALVHAVYDIEDHVCYQSVFVRQTLTYPSTPEVAMQQ